MFEVLKKYKTWQEHRHNQWIENVEKTSLNLLLWHIRALLFLISLLMISFISIFVAIFKP